MGIAGLPTVAQNPGGAVKIVRWGTVEKLVAGIRWVSFGLWVRWPTDVCQFGGPVDSPRQWLHESWMWYMVENNAIQYIILWHKIHKMALVWEV